MSRWRFINVTWSQFQPFVTTGKLLVILAFIQFLMVGYPPVTATAQESSDRDPKARGVQLLPRNVWIAEDFDPDDSQGIFVGVSRFDHLPKIRFAVDDAIDLAHLFSIELGLITTERVRLLLSGKPQKVGTLRRLENLQAGGARVTSASRTQLHDALFTEARQAGTRGLLVITIATHGYSSGGSHYLMASDDHWIVGNDHDGEAGQNIKGILTSQALLDPMLQPSSRRRIVFLDACQAIPHRAGFDPRAAIPAQLAEAIRKIHGDVVVSAARPGGYAFDDEYANGVFSGAIIDGIQRCAAATDPRNFVTIDTLINYVDEAVTAWVKEEKGPNPGWDLGIQKNGGGPIWDLPLKICEATLPWEGRRAGLPPTAPQPFAVWEDRKAAMKFRFIPAGHFTTGRAQSPKGIEEGEVREVEIREGFWMAETEVTQAQWQYIMGSLPPRNERCDDCPVRYVDWFEALTFTNILSKLSKLEPCFDLECTGMPGEENRTCWSAKLNDSQCSGYRLPFEEEWEYACRAGSQAPFWFGSQQRDLEKYGWYVENSEGTVHPVRDKSTANAWGFYGVHGNVAEWTLSPWNSEGESSPKEKQQRERGNQSIPQLHQDPTNNRFVVRGGDFGSPAERANCLFRDAGYPEMGSAGQGFRILLPTLLGRDKNP
jgi:formylglycine-generating enzyme required for sulfatase activity